MKLNEMRLRQILNKINSDPQMKEQYSSKWHRVVNFLYSNTGLKIAEVGKSGSQAKLTDYNDSDLDVIFRTSKDYDLKGMLKYIAEKAEAIFAQVAEVGIGKKAVHIEFYNPECDIDVVYFTKQKFKAERKKIKVIRQISQVRRDSIKLAKYTLDRAGIRDVEGHEVEKACLHFEYKTLAEYTYHNIKHFTGRIRKYGLEFEDVLRLLK